SAPTVLQHFWPPCVFATTTTPLRTTFIYIITTTTKTPLPNCQPPPPDHVVASQPRPRLSRRLQNYHRIFICSPIMADDSGWLQWALILVLTALLLSVVVLAQTASAYWAAYVAAPREMATFIDTVDFSIQENESYDKDMTKVQRLEDKLRLGQLLREIQKSGDDLREELNSLLIAAENPPPPPPLPRDIEKTAAFTTPSKPALRKSLTDSVPKRPPVRRLTTQAIGHQENMASTGRLGWGSVVEELQLSPRMHQRHASIERSMSVERSLSPRERAS
ncbi:hypothetical protein LLEC1_05242, partial [Akanthomyces lecanii]